MTTHNTFILNVQGKPFMDADAANEKARLMTTELGLHYISVPNPEGGGFVVTRGEGAGNTYPSQGMAKDGVVEDKTESHEPGISPKIESVLKKPPPIVAEDITNRDRDGGEEAESAEVMCNQTHDVFANALNRNNRPTKVTKNAEDGLNNFDNIINTKAIENDADEIPAISSRPNKQMSSKEGRAKNLPAMDEDENAHENFYPITLRPSPLSFIGQYITFVLAAVVHIDPGLFWHLFVTQQDVIYGNKLLQLFPAIVSLIAVIMMAHAIARILYGWYSHKYIIGYPRIESRNGIIRRNNPVIRIDRIQTLDYANGFWGRLLGYGDVYISAAGQQGNDLIMHNIQNPVKVKNIIEERMDYAQNAMMQAGVMSRNLGNV